MRKLSFILGLLGPLAFIFLSGLAMHLNPQFNTTTTAESDLVNTPFGWLQNAAFIGGGIGFVFMGMSMALSQQKSKVVPYLVIFFGLAFFLESIFPSNSNSQQMDPVTAIHILIFASGTLGLVVATGLFGKKLGKINVLMSLYSFLTTLVAGAGFVGIFATQGAVGLWQQVTIFPLLLWMEIIGIYTFVRSRELSF